MASETSRAATVLIHISDLHLGPRLVEQGRVIKEKLGVRSHKFFLLQAAAAAIKKIYVKHRGQVVALIVSGDVTTAGDPSAFRLGRQFIETGHVSDGESDWPMGLGPTASRSVVVPGNHDRYRHTWMWRQNSAFEEEFRLYCHNENDSKYKHVEKDRLPSVRVIESSSNDIPSMVVIGIDSTELLPLTETLHFVNRIAQGRVSSRSLAFIDVLLERWRKEGVIFDSEGVEYSLENVRIVVVLHHHPYLPPDQKFGWATLLRNKDEVLDCFHRNSVDLVMYGHEHLAFVDSPTLKSGSQSPHSILCAAAGSLCVHDEKFGNSFNVYELDARGVVYTRWNFEAPTFEPTTPLYRVWQ